MSAADETLKRLAEAREAGSTLAFLREMVNVMKDFGQILDNAIEGAYENDCFEEITNTLEAMKLECDAVLEQAEAQRSELEDEGEDDADDEADDDEG